MARKNSISAAQITTSSRGDLMNEMNQLLGELGAQLSMMQRMNGEVFDESMPEEDRDYYVHAMAEQVYRLKEVSAKLWEAS